MSSTELKELIRTNTTVSTTTIDISEEATKSRCAVLLAEYHRIVDTNTLVPQPAVATNLHSSNTKSAATSKTTACTTTTSTTTTTTGTDRPIKIAFPEKLHILLTLAPQYGCGHVMSWLVHGRSFKIPNEDYFLRFISSK
jgi:hypothetical protein